MKTITRQEEQLLLIIHGLKEEAYLVNIREGLKEMTGKYLDVGSINKPLKRLTKEGFLEAYMGDPTPIRGGRAIRFYKLTDKGYSALSEVKSLHDRFWDNVIIPLKNS
ncbi:PadR family transcriptional regulator [candidate division KSB1 bacterium]